MLNRYDDVRAPNLMPSESVDRDFPGSQEEFSLGSMLVSVGAVAAVGLTAFVGLVPAVIANKAYQEAKRAYHTIRGRTVERIDDHERLFFHYEVKK